MVKDLGVKITTCLTSRNQCHTAAMKARKVMGIIKRTFQNLTEASFRTVYTSFVRPHLEYCSAAWNPHQAKDIKLLEDVQRWATKLVGPLRNKSYKKRLESLKLPTLSSRRFKGDLIEAYKLINNVYKIDTPNLVTINKCGRNAPTLYKYRFHTSIRKHFL